MEVKSFLLFMFVSGVFALLINEILKPPKRKHRPRKRQLNAWKAPKEPNNESQITEIANEVIANIKRSLDELEEKPNSPFKRRKYFFSLAEKRLFNELRELDSYDILSKVRLIDVIEPRTKSDYTARAKLIQKHIDFLIMDKKTNETLLAIELDGRSHNNQKQKLRDEEKDRIFKEAGIKLIRLENNDRRNMDKIKQELEEMTTLWTH